MLKYFDNNHKVFHRSQQFNKNFSAHINLIKLKQKEIEDKLGDYWRLAYPYYSDYISVEEDLNTSLLRKTTSEPSDITEFFILDETNVENFEEILKKFGENYFILKNKWKF